MIKINNEIKNEILRAEKIGEYVIIKVEDKKALLSAKSKDGNMEFLTQINIQSDSSETYILNKKAIAALRGDEEFEITKVKDEIKIKSSTFKAVFKEPTEVDLSTMNTECVNLISVNIVNAKKVMYATGINETRPVLQGVCFKFIDDKSIDIVAMDGYRVAKTNVEFEVIKKDMPVPTGEFVINKSNLAKIISLTDKTVGLSVLSDKVLFLFGKSIIAVKTMSDKYIDYNKMLNIKLDGKTDIVKEDIVNVLNKFSLISENRQVNLAIKRDSIEINSKDTTSLLEDSIMCESSKDVDISFNQKYLIEFFEYIEEENISISYKDSRTAIKITDGVTENLVLPVASAKK